MDNNVGGTLSHSALDRTSFQNTRLQVDLKVEMRVREIFACRSFLVNANLETLSLINRFTKLVTPWSQPLRT